VSAIAPMLVKMVSLIILLFIFFAPFTRRLRLVLRIPPFLADNIWLAIWFQNPAEHGLSRTFRPVPLCNAPPFAYRGEMTDDDRGRALPRRTTAQ